MYICPSPFCELLLVSRIESREDRTFWTEGDTSVTIHKNKFYDKSDRIIALNYVCLVSIICACALPFEV